MPGPVKAKLADVLAKHQRVAIVGGPRTGKTTLAGKVEDRPVVHADDYKALQWENQPAVIRGLVAMEKRVVVEGVQVGRALRKGMEVDAVIVMREPKTERTKGQEAMAKGAEKILKEALELHPGVPVYEVEE